MFGEEGSSAGRREEIVEEIALVLKWIRGLVQSLSRAGGLKSTASADVTVSTIARRRLHEALAGAVEKLGELSDDEEDLLPLQREAMHLITVIESSLARIVTQ